MGRNKLKLIFLLTILVQLFTAQVVLAQTTQGTTGAVQSIADQYSGPQATIEQYLCTPYTGPVTTTSGSSISSSWTAAAPAGATNPAAGDLYTCINKIYRFAIILASVGAVLYIVIAGYMYMSAEGNQETVDKAKSYITTAITALAILFAGYIILRFINPDLIQFQNIQPPSVVPASTTPPSTSATNPLTGTGATTANSNTSCNQNFGLSASADSCNSSAGSCVNVSNYTSTHDCSSNNGICLLSPNAAQRAQTFINTFNTLANGSGCSLKISAAIEGATGPSVSSCHTTGTCVDFNILPSYTTACQQIFYNAAQQSGTVVSFLDEYNPTCIAPSTTGGNIHVNF